MCLLNKASLLKSQAHLKKEKYVSVAKSNWNLDLSKYFLLTVLLSEIL